ncbi:IS256 family transposase, partial [Mobiluncus mulieris]|nr:IS256 family transposase [Mobiluncus mulieris]
CLVHIKRNVCAQTTRTPKLDAHKALWGLAQKLVKITSLQQADEWTNQLQQFHDLYSKWLGEKTYRSEVLPDNVPTWVRPNQEWWYTHQNARKAYNLLASQTRRGTLFAFLNPHLQAQATLPL